VAKVGEPANHLRWLYAVEGLRPLTARGREAVGEQVGNNGGGDLAMKSPKKNSYQK